MLVRFNGTYATFAPLLYYHTVSYVSEGASHDLSIVASV